MSTKFVSKNSNYMVVLRPGIEGNRALGTHSTPGLYVKFQAGMVIVSEESIVKLLRQHQSFGTDFVEIKETELDPYAETREEIEPPHTMSDIVYGHSERRKTVGRPPKMKITKELKKTLEAEAMRMIPTILKDNPEVLKNIIVSLATEMKAKESPKPNLRTEDAPVGKAEETTSEKTV